jgi:hypothetical protein
MEAALPQQQNYTAVMHLGADHAGKPGSSRGLEARAVNARELPNVLDAGGVVFNDYLATDKFCEDEMHPF